MKKLVTLMLAVMLALCACAYAETTDYTQVPEGMVVGFINYTDASDTPYNFHKGIDIACYGSAYGKDIRAAADGTVLYANKYDSWGGGYGYYLMVDHGYDANGQRIVTLYAHCSYIIASEGETVRQGQQIAEIGNTGWSYGAHLHFEVRVDGSPVDPLTNGWVVQP